MLQGHVSELAIDLNMPVVPSLTSACDDQMVQMVTIMVTVLSLSGHHDLTQRLQRGGIHLLKLIDKVGL